MVLDLCVLDDVGFLIIVYSLFLNNKTVRARHVFYDFFLFLVCVCLDKFLFIGSVCGWC